MIKKSADRSSNESTRRRRRRRACNCTAEKYPNGPAASNATMCLPLVITCGIVSFGDDCRLVGMHFERDAKSKRNASTVTATCQRTLVVDMLPQSSRAARSLVTPYSAALCSTCTCWPLFWLCSRTAAVGEASEVAVVNVYVLLDASLHFMFNRKGDGITATNPS